MTNTLISEHPKLAPSNESWRPWVIWALGAAFFLFEYVVRVSPSVMAPWLIQDFHTNALGIGTLSSLYYFTYIIMQLPVGAMVDRYGSTRLLTIMTALCAVACLLFAQATSLWVAGLARMTIGFATAFAFVGALKLVTQWFPIERFAFLAGCTQALGMVGGALGEAPMSYVVRELGWQQATMWCSLLFVILSVLFALFVRDAPAQPVANRLHKTKETTAGVLVGLKIVLCRKDMWINAGFAGFLYASSAAFAELWGVMFLQHAYHLSHQQAANAAIMIFIGWGVGGPLTGWLAGKVGSRRPLRLFSAIGGGLLMSLIIYGHDLSYFAICSILFIYGIINSGLMLAYATAGEIEPKEVSGASIAFSNMASVIIGAALQPVIGALLDQRWGGLVDELGHRIYSPETMREVLFLLPVCFAIAAVFAWFVPESKRWVCHSKEPSS